MPFAATEVPSRRPAGASRWRCAAGLLLVAAALTPCAGCMIGQALSAAAYYAEHTKELDVPPKYAGLENKSVAVLVHADMGTLYENPAAPANIAVNVSGRIQTNVPGVKVRDPRQVMTWQYHTPGWSSMAFGDIARELDVDRVVYIDLYEYRLNPPGNRWVWEGVAAANVGIIERDGLDPDVFADNFNIVATFPAIDGLGRDAASESQIETGLLIKFVEKASWLFYQHLEPKYPDERPVRAP